MRSFCRSMTKSVSVKLFRDGNANFAWTAQNFSICTLWQVKTDLAWMKMLQSSMKTKVFCVVMTKSVSHSYNLAMAIQIFYGQRNFVVHSICSLNLLHRSPGLSIYVQQRQLVWAQYSLNFHWDLHGISIENNEMYNHASLPSGTQKYLCSISLSIMYIDVGGHY